MKILITGAGGGIGLLTALTLAYRHHFVYLTTHTNEEAKHVKKIVKSLNYSNVEVLKADITQDKDCDKLLELNFDCLINNAAFATGGSVLDTNIDIMRALYEVNLFASFALLQKAYQKFQKQKKGRIIVMSSLTALFPVPFLGVYSSSKAAISSLVTSLRNENKLLNNTIDFVLIEPGMYHTGFNQYMLSHILDDKIFENMDEDIYKIESVLFRMFEKNSLTSIVTKIIKAVEDEKPKKVYRAPFSHSLFCKCYNVFK